jgi:hypothetical protein
MPQGYPGPGIYATPHPTHPNMTMRLGATPASNVGFGLAVAVTAGIVLATIFTVMVKA